jgi:LysR family transcriptional regulator, transcriptional activator for bauABCD operon
MYGALSDIDLRLLRVFKAVVECGGFSAAETELNIQRSTISTHMADLEARLGYRLCQRGRAGFALTQGGQVVYDAIVQLFASIDRFGEHVESAAGELTGQIALGIVDNTITDPGAGIVESLAGLKAHAPGARIALQVGSPTQIERDVLSGQLQIGVVPLIHPLPGLEYMPLYHEHNQLFCGQGHELFGMRKEGMGVEEVLRHDYVARGYDGGVEVKTRHLPFRIMGTAQSMEGAATLILTGKYIAFLPVHYASYWVDRRQMQSLEVAETSFQIEFNLVTRRGATPSLVARLFLDQLRAFHDTNAVD